MSALLPVVAMVTPVLVIAYALDRVGVVRRFAEVLLGGEGE